MWFKEFVSCIYRYLNKIGCIYVLIYGSDLAVFVLTLMNMMFVLVTFIFVDVLLFSLHSVE